MYTHNPWQDYMFGSATAAQVKKEATRAISDVYMYIYIYIYTYMCELYSHLACVHERTVSRPAGTVSLLYR